MCKGGAETRQLILLALEKTAVLQKHVGKNNASWMACGAETRTRFCCAENVNANELVNGTKKIGRRKNNQRKNVEYENSTCFVPFRWETDNWEMVQSELTASIAKTSEWKENTA